jgi:mevalonate kinase
MAVKVTVKFKLPACVGLGSSGAFCVCIASALLQTAGLIPPPSIVVDDEGSLTWDEVHLDIIRKWSAAAESLIHGRASGLDAAICTYGMPNLWLF